MKFEYDTTTFDNLNESEELLVDLLIKHQKDFSEMESLKTLLKKLFFPDAHLEDIIKRYNKNK